MIQFNLLPDVKVQYIKTRRLKRIMLLVSFVAASASALLLFLAFSYTAVQKRHLTNLDADINRMEAEFQSNTELTRILSVQNQLNALPALYDGRPAVDRLPDYLDQTTPNGIRISSLTIDFSTSAVVISGKASSLELVNSYVDTLKFTAFKTNEEGSTPLNAFSAIVLTQFTRNDTEAGFTISFLFDPIIFDNTKQVELLVPSLVTTRAKTVSPEELFTSDTGNETNGEEQNGE